MYCMYAVFKSLALTQCLQAIIIYTDLRPAVTTINCCSLSFGLIALAAIAESNNLIEANEKQTKNS